MPLVRPRFAYLSPFLRQSKAVAWDYLRAGVAPLRRPAPPCTRANCGSIIPAAARSGSTAPTIPIAMRGIYLDGIVLDEYADMDPRVWSEIIRPALADRQGWAVFIGTPKGRNAFFELWRRAQREDGWFAMMLKASDTGLIPDSGARAGAARSHRGAIRAGVRMLVRRRGRRRLFRRAISPRPKRSGRIAGVPYDPAAAGRTPPGISASRDATAIWFVQVDRRAKSASSITTKAHGVDLGHYVGELSV